MAEGRSNPLDPVSIAGYIAAGMAIDAVVTVAYNAAVDGVKIAAGVKKASTFNPFDDSESWKIKGLFGTLTWLTGKGVEKASVAAGVDEQTASTTGKVVTASLDVASIFGPGAARGAIVAGKAFSAGTRLLRGGAKLKVLSGGARLSGQQLKNAVEVTKQSFNAAVKNLKRVRKLKIKPSAKKKALKKAMNQFRKAEKNFADAKKGLIRAPGEIQKLLAEQGKLMHDISNVSGKVLPSINAVLRGADVFDDYDKLIKGVYGDPDLELNQSFPRLADDLADYIVKINSNSSPDLARRPISQDYFRLQRLRYPEAYSEMYEPIQPEISSIPDALPTTFKNPLFTPPLTLAPSTGGFTDAAIILPLRFRVFDTAVEDGDIVRLEVRSSNGVNLGPTNVTLTNAGQTFSPTVAAGPVQVTLTAVNEGSLPPNTGGLNILSTVTRGQSNQEFSLQTGGSGSLNIVADPPSTPPSTPQITQPSPL